MLLQFSVENFRSFKEKAVLSMEASVDQDLPENIVETDNYRSLKVATIFGANASGKSNIFKALTAAIITIRMSNNNQVGTRLQLMVPFSFDAESAHMPCRFEFVFIAKEKKYVYGFSATDTRITEEYLYLYKSTRHSTIFERTNDEFRFTSATLAKKLKPITERNTSNKLFLATATAWNCQETQIPFMWFAQGINTYTPEYARLLSETGPMFEQDPDMSLRHFTNRLLHEADINITDYIIESREIPVADTPPGIDLIGKEFQITTMHKVADGSIFPLNLRDESEGTINLFFFAPLIKRAFESGEVLCIDEFDVSLHPMLVQYLVRLFNMPSVNKNNAQLIVSTHTSGLLNLRDLRRDQIYFTEKNQIDGCSTIYSLDEFSPRKREDVQKAYLLGRYGSVPEIGEGDLWQ